MTRMNRVHRYPPVGKCIYCGSDGAPGQLGLEHIIAESLGGMLLLPASSCGECAKATSAVEGRIAGELFRAIRRQMQFPNEEVRELARRAALQLTDSLAWGSTASSDRRARCCRPYQETRGIAR
jgi:hypothetical protein